MRRAVVSYEGHNREPVRPRSSSRQLVTIRVAGEMEADGSFPTTRVIYDLAGNVQTSLSLTKFSQQQGKLSGYLTVGSQLQGSGAFSTPAMQPQNVPPVQIVSAWNRLTPDKQLRAVDVAHQFNPQDLSAVSTFGMHLQANLNKVTDPILQKIKISESGLAGQLLEQLERETSKIDFETLQNTHRMLVDTVKETRRIYEEGRQKRIASEKQLEGMRNELRDTLSQLPPP